MEPDLKEENKVQNDASHKAFPKSRAGWWQRMQFPGDIPEVLALQKAAKLKVASPF